MYPSIPSTSITTISLQTDRPSPNYIHGRPPSTFNIKTTQLHRLYAKRLIYLAPLQPFPRFDVYVVRGPGAGSEIRTHVGFPTAYKTVPIDHYGIPAYCVLSLLARLADCF